MILHAETAGVSHFVTAADAADVTDAAPVQPAQQEVRLTPLGSFGWLAHLLCSTYKAALML